MATSSGNICFDLWLKIGQKLNFVGAIVCVTHDGLPMTYEEEDNNEYDDPCIPILRCYESYEQKVLIEQNHSPSVWRNE